MKTMTQHPENNYDIDDGVYFEATDPLGRRAARCRRLTLGRWFGDS
jgi:hypothetical protein